MMPAHKLQGERAWHGLSIAIENLAGTRRGWKDPSSGDEGSTLMLFDYGYIRGTEGKDGDQVDCYLGPDPCAEWVYVVHQKTKPKSDNGDQGEAFKKFDEDKCMLDFGSPQEARRAYRLHYDDGRFYGSMTAMSVPEFIAKVLHTKDLKRPGMIRSLAGGVLARAVTTRRAHLRWTVHGPVMVRRHAMGYEPGHPEAHSPEAHSPEAEQETLWEKHDLGRWGSGPGRPKPRHRIGIVRHTPPATDEQLALVEEEHEEGSLL